MQYRVEEGAQPQHSPELNQPAPAGEPAGGGNGERHDKEDERENPGRVNGEIDRIGTKSATPGVPRKECDRHKAIEQHDGLGKSIDLQERPR